MNSGRVIYTGQAIVDLVLTIPTLPRRGGDVFSSSHQISAGGGFNVMAAASRDGAEVVYPGGHGTGYFGDVVRRAMSAEGIDVLQRPQLGQDTGFSVAMVDQDAERTFVSTLGAEQHLSVEDLNAVEVDSRDVVAISGYSLFHPSTAAAITSWLPTLPPVSVLVDPSPMIEHVPVPIFESVLEHATHWSLNEAEARIVAGRLAVNVPGFPGFPGEQGAAQLAQTLAHKLDAVIVLRVNNDGAWVAQRDAPAYRVRAFPVTAVDTNGAGDAHTGVLCAGLAEADPHVDLRALVRRANAAAAIAVSRQGPASSPKRAEIDALLERYPQ